MVHVGVDNLNVVRNVNRLVDEFVWRPLELGDDGDILAHIRSVLALRGRETVRITKVKGHAADDEMVRLGVVRALDKDVDDRADAAADRGRRHVWRHVLDARVNQAYGLRCPIIDDLHRFAVARVVVNDDGRVALPMTLWFGLLVVF